MTVRFERLLCYAQREVARALNSLFRKPSENEGSETQLCPGQKEVF
jgi:hypothetical protein